VEWMSLLCSLISAIGRSPMLCSVTNLGMFLKVYFVHPVPGILWVLVIKSYSACFTGSNSFNSCKKPGRY
jgi:hypothetical protein